MGHVNITKLLLETASRLGTEILEKLIFDVNARGENAIKLMAEHGLETFFAHFFKILKDDYPAIWEKATKMYDNIQLERKLHWYKEKLIMAIESGDIQEVKDVLSNAKDSSMNPSEILRILVSGMKNLGYRTLLIACKERYTEIIKELLCYALNINDGGASLKELLTKSTYIPRLTPQKAFKHESEIKQILDHLIVEARNSNRYYAVDILEQLKNRYFKPVDSLEELLIRSLEETLLLPSFYSSSDDSD